MHQNFEQIKDKVTPEFLSTLYEVGKCYSWWSDYTKICAFITDLHDEMGTTCPDMTCYERLEE